MLKKIEFAQTSGVLLVQHSIHMRLWPKVYEIEFRDRYFEIIKLPGFRFWNYGSLISGIPG
jgi:hypothetical protein